MTDTIFGEWRNVSTMGDMVATTALSINSDRTYRNRMCYETPQFIQVVEHDGTLTLDESEFVVNLDGGKTSKAMKDGSSDGFELRDFDDEEQAETLQMLAEPIRYQIVAGQLVTTVQGPAGQMEIVYERV
jgi:hypothetical protein